MLRPPRALRRAAAFLLVLLPILAANAATTAAPHSLRIVNANVHTLDPTRPHASSICLRGDRIEQVGSPDDTRSCGAATRARSTCTAPRSCPAGRMRTITSAVSAGARCV